MLTASVKRTVGLALMLFSPLLLAAPGLQQLVENARYWEQNGRGDLARAALEKRLRVEPDNAAVYYQLGMTGIRMGEAFRCPDVLARMRTRLPAHELTNALAQECRAATRYRVDMAKLQILKDAERFQEAFTLFRELYPEGPPPGRLGVEYLLLEQQSGAPTSSWQALHRYANQYPEDVDFQLRYAELLTTTPQTASRAEALARSLIQRPQVERQTVLEIWQAALERLGPERVSDAMFARYLQYDPRNDSIRSLRNTRIRQTARESASIALRADTPPSFSTIDRLRDAVRRYPTDPWVRYDLVRLLLRRGLQNEAIDQLQAGLRAAPRDAEMRRMSAQVYAQLGMSRQARTVLEAVSEDQQTRASQLQLLRLQAQQQAREGRSAAVRQTYAAVLAHPDVQAGDFRDYARFLEQHATADSVQVLRRGVERFPDDVWLHHQLARQYVTGGHQARAVALMLEVMDVAGNTPTSLYALALIQDAAGRPLAALQSLQTIPEAHRDDAQRNMLTRLNFERCFAIAEEAEALFYCSQYTENVWERHQRIALARHRLGQTQQGWNGFSRWAATQTQTPEALLRRLDVALDMGLQSEAPPLIRTLRQLETRIGADGDLATPDFRRQLDTLEIRDLLDRERTPAEQRRLRALSERLAQQTQGRPPEGSALRVMARAYRALGQQDEAVSAMAQLMAEADARDTDTLDYLDLLILQGDYGRAEEVLRERWPAAPVAARLALAKRWYQISPQQALDQLSALQHDPAIRDADADPDTALGVQLLLAQYQTDFGEYERAEAHFQSALALAPDAERRAQVEQTRKAVREGRYSWMAAGVELARIPGTAGVSRVDLKQSSLEMYAAPEWARNAFVKIDPTSIAAGALARADADDYAQYASLTEDARANAPLGPYKYARGVAVGFGARVAHWSVDFGLTPLGFERQQWVGGVSYSGTWAAHDLSLGLLRRAISSTFLSYAGDRDPVSGEFWGAPLAEGFQFRVARYQARLSYFLDATFQQVSGKNVAANNGVVSRAGVDYKWVDRPHWELFASLGLSYWAYEKNLRFYTFGHGGYYSPQSYTSVSLPVEVRGLLTARWSYQLQARAGYSWSREDAADYFPGRPDLQQQARNQGIEPVHAGGRGSGANFSWRVATEYRLAEHWAVGASLSQDRSAFYEPDFVQIYLRRSFSFSRSPLYVPPRPVEAYQ